MRARAYRLSGGIRHPLRNGFTAYAVLSPATNSSCHRRRRISRLLDPVGSELATADLAPATGVRTTRFCRTLQRRSSCAPANRSRGSTRPATSMARRRSRVHHIPSRVRDDARPPLLSERDSVDSRDVSISRRNELFFRRGLDDPNQLEFVCEISIYVKSNFRPAGSMCMAIAACDLLRRANQWSCGMVSEHDKRQ
jgi:hypothetical protein